jgi:hypothetical protein
VARGEVVSLSLVVLKIGFLFFFCGGSEGAVLSFFGGGEGGFSFFGNWPA